jgi:hypothetical protein
MNDEELPYIKVDYTEFNEVVLRANTAGFTYLMKMMNDLGAEKSLGNHYHIDHQARSGILEGNISELILEYNEPQAN